MSSGIKILETIQAGKESTKGTAVAATRRIIADGSYERIQEVSEFTDQNSGVFARVPRQGVITKNASEIEITTPLDFQQILLPLLSGVKGAVTPVSGTGDETWTFLPSTSAPPALDAYTMEFAEVSPDDNSNMEFAYGLTEEIEITASDDGLPELRWKMFGRSTTDTTMTPALAVPSLAYAANPLWAVAMNDSWATLGDTPILAQIYGFRWSYKNAVHPGFYLDNRTTLDFSTEEFGRPEIELELDVVHDPAAAAFVQTEEADKTSQNLRFVRCELVGGTVGLLNYTVTLDGAFYHAADSMQQRGSDRDGNITTRMHFVSSYDSTSSNQVQIEVINELATFPV